MRAIVLLSLLNAAFAATHGNFGGWPQDDNPHHKDCLKDRSSCGCCLMKEKMQRMETFFGGAIRAATKCLAKPKMVLDNMMTNRSAFSVALNHSGSVNCVGPFPVVKYNHVFLNMGDGYNAMTGIFTVPRSGVYSFAVTVYSASKTSSTTCGVLMVNGTEVAKVIERKGQDDEDSATVVVSVKLTIGDEVWVKLPDQCTICDNENHFNTFTGFLLYSDIQYKM